jgi:hypothetical protein
MRIPMWMINLAVITLLLIVTDRNRVSAATCDPTNCVTYYDIIPNFADQPTIRSTQSWNQGCLGST